MAVKLKGPHNHGGFSFRGESFTPDENGLIDVPHEALDEAFSHGFKLPQADEPEDDGQGDDKPSKKNGKKSA